MNYTLDVSAAKKADTNANQRIQDAGEYDGIITQAEALNAKSGAKGIKLAFESDFHGDTVFNVYTHSSNGDTIFGFDKIMAVMACTKTRSLTARNARVKRYNWETKEDEIVDGVIYPELIGKRIGFLIQIIIDDYNGKDVRKTEIFSVFEPGTRFSSTEILDQASKATMTDKRLEQLMKKPEIDKRKGGSEPKYPAQTVEISKNDDNEIPF